MGVGGVTDGGLRARAVRFKCRCTLLRSTGAASGEERGQDAATPHSPPHHYPTHSHSKHKAVHKAAGGDDKRLQSTLKRLGVTTIPGGSPGTSTA